MTNKFSTSFYTEKSVFEIKSDRIIINKLPSDKSFDEIMIYLRDGTGQKYNKQVLNRVASKYRDYYFSNVPYGIYYLSILRKSIIEENRFYSYIDGVDIPIKYELNRWCFVEADVLCDNIKFIQNIKTDIQSLQTYTKPSYYIQSYDAEIRKKANEITRFSHNNYHKLLAIHNWVARTLYYDYDSLMDCSYKSMNISAINTLSTGKSVCQGYTELSIAIMRAVGIPALGVICYALDFNTMGGWNNPICHSETNHIFTIAFVDNRWIIMDSTWDSFNRFENKEFINMSSNGIFTKHFDMTLAFVSNTHYFSKIFV